MTSFTSTLNNNSDQARAYNTINLSRTHVLYIQLHLIAVIISDFVVTVTTAAPSPVSFEETIARDVSTAENPNAMLSLNLSPCSNGHFKKLQYATRRAIEFRAICAWFSPAHALEDETRNLRCQRVWRSPGHGARRTYVVSVSRTQKLKRREKSEERGGNGTEKEEEEEENV